MFELKTLSGEVIDLDKNEATIELNNSLFTDGSRIPGSLSYPIAVSFSKKNKMLLGYAHAVETGVKSTSVEVYARIAGKSFRRCNLKVNIGDGAFDCNLEIDLGTINNYISTAKLSDIPVETFHLGQTPEQIADHMWTAAVNRDWREIPYTFFPVRNPGFTGDPVAKPALVPTYSGDPENPIAIPAAYATKGELINSIFKDDDGFLHFNVQTAWDTNARFHTTPFFYLPYILTKIAQDLGLNATGDFLQHPDIGNLVLYNLNATFVTRYGIAGYAEQEQEGIYISASDHLPDITISDFFKILVSYFCIRITPDIASGELNFSWKKSTFEKPVFKDWSDKLIRIRKQEFEVSQGYQISTEVDKLDQDKEVVTDTLKVGNGKDKIEVKAGALRAAEENMLDTEYQWNIPFDNRSGNVVDPLFNELSNFKAFGNFNAFPVRFIFYGGISTYKTNPIPYPRATADGADFSLTLASIYQFALKPWWSRTYAAKKVTASFRLTATDLCQLGDSDIILLKGENGTTVQALYERLVFTSKGEKQLSVEADLIILDSNFIAKAPDTGIFIKLTELNPQTTSYDNGVPDPLPEATTVPVSGTTTKVDLKIELFSDRACSLPLQDPDVMVYLKLQKLENWKNVFYFKQLLPPAIIPLRTETTAYEVTEYRKVHCTSNQVILYEVEKTEIAKFYVTTTEPKWMVTTINRETRFALQDSSTYYIAD